MTQQILAEASNEQRRCLCLIRGLLAFLYLIETVLKCASLWELVLTSVLKSHAAIIDSRTMQFFCLNFLVLKLLSHFSCHSLSVYLHDLGQPLDFHIHLSRLSRFEFIESSY